MRAFWVVGLMLVAEAVQGAEVREHKDLAYAEPKSNLQSLDIYAPADGHDLPIVVWIHGGGWRQGDKAGVQRKPQAMADKGYVFASINYRFVPEVTIAEMTGDVARAIRWVHDHATEYGGKPDKMFVMGHSAGAHLAALVCTDDSYLKAQGLPLSTVVGCVPVDVSVYDIPKRLTEEPVNRNFDALFGETSEEQRQLSPAAHVAAGKGIPSFLILHVAERPETKRQSEMFAAKLREAGVAATVFGAEGKTHGTINSELGLPDDPATVALWKFMAECLN